MVPNSTPLVSILMICRNAAPTIRRAIDSVLAQEYSNLELVIQDGASTDQTLEIIRSYNDARIRLDSRPDHSSAEAYFNGLLRCRGEIIGLCWADEEYFPFTVSWGVEGLQRNPGVALIYGDVYSSDIRGKIHIGSLPGPEWDLEKFLCWEIMPNYCSSFCWSWALRASGLLDVPERFCGPEDGHHGCLMYDYYAMVGLLFPIMHVPGFVGKFSVHAGQLSSTPAVLKSMLVELTNSYLTLEGLPQYSQRLSLLKERAFSGFHLAMLNSLLYNADAHEEACAVLSSALGYKSDLRRLKKVVDESCLYYLNRNLDFYTTSEFRNGLSSAGLCAAIDKLMPGLPLKVPEYSIERLNEVMTLRDLPQRLRGLGRLEELPVAIEHLVAETERFHAEKRFDDLEPDQKLLLVRQNRLLLEHVLPGQSPRRASDRSPSRELLEFTDILLQAGIHLQGIRECRAKALLVLGRLDEAMGELQQEVDRDPQSIEARIALFGVEMEKLASREFLLGMLGEDPELLQWSDEALAKYAKKIHQLAGMKYPVQCFHGLSTATLATLRRLADLFVAAARKAGFRESECSLSLLSATMQIVMAERS